MLKYLFIDSGGNINTDLIITILASLGVFSVPSLLINFFRNCSKSYKRYRIFVKNTKKQIFNTLLFPWEEQKHKFGVDHRRFYINQLNIENTDDTAKKVQIKKGVNMFFLGKPGSGKTTYINHLYLSQFSFINNIIHFYFGYRFYYAKAEELLNLSDEFPNALNDLFTENLKSRVFVFIDAIDEVKIDNINDLVEKLIILQRNNVTIIATCRKEEHEVLLRINNDYAKVIDQVFEISDWNEVQVQRYLKKYKKYAYSNDFSDKISEYFSEKIYSDFFKTPLELSLLIFIVDHSSNINMINYRYELYEQFVTKWLIRDCFKNEISYENNNYIKKVLFYFSLCAFHLYVNEQWLSANVLTQINPTYEYYLNGLFKYKRENDNKYIVGFYHLNFQDFFLSYFFFNSLLEISENTIKALSVKYNHTVTRFIKNKLSLYSKKDLENIKNTLLNIMHKLCKIQINNLRIYNISISNSTKDYYKALSNEFKTVVRNEIYFFLARLPWNQDNQNNELLHILQSAYHYEPDIRAKRTIAISAAILGDENIELEYAKEILNNDNSNLIDRSFTLVYYQDVSYSNPFTYIDDNVSQWTNSRRSRINRLNSNDEKSQRMRTFDLITILNFVKSRNGYIPTQEEYDIINNCQINCNNYSNEKIQLLTTVKNELLNLLQNP